MICFFAIYSKIIIFAPTNMEQGRMILLRIAGRTTQGKAYFGKALSNLLSVKVIMSFGKYKGKSIEEVCKTDRQHLIWLSQNNDSFNLDWEKFK